MLPGIAVVRHRLVNNRKFILKLENISNLAVSGVITFIMTDFQFKSL